MIDLFVWEGAWGGGIEANNLFCSSHHMSYVTAKQACVSVRAASEPSAFYWMLSGNTAGFPLVSGSTGVRASRPW